MRDSSPTDAPCLHMSRPDWPLACARAQRDVARLVHDGIGQLVAAIGMTVTRLGSASATEDDHQVARKRLCGLVSELATTIRSVESALHPAILDQAGLNAALRTRLGQASDQTGCEAWAAHFDDTIDAAVADPLLTYRIAESLLVTYLSRLRPRAFALTLQATPAATRVELMLEGGHPPLHHDHPAHGAGAPFSFIDLNDWLTAAQATLQERATEPARHVVTINIPHRDIEEEA